MEEARQRASCMGYSIGAEEERGFEDLLTISEWVDSGQVSYEDGLNDIEGIMAEFLPVSYHSTLSHGTVLIKVERRSDLAGYARAIEVSDDG